MVITRDEAGPDPFHHGYPHGVASENPVDLKLGQCSAFRHPDTGSQQALNGDIEAVGAFPHVPVVDIFNLATIRQ